MAVPRNRHSSGRTHRRRAHDALKAVQTGTCRGCGEPKLPHRVCPKCGTYRGRTLREQTADAE